MICLASPPHQAFSPRFAKPPQQFGSPPTAPSCTPNTHTCSLSLQLPVRGGLPSEAPKGASSGRGSMPCCHSSPFPGHSSFLLGSLCELLGREGALYSFSLGPHAQSFCWVLSLSSLGSLGHPDNLVIARLPLLLHKPLGLSDLSLHQGTHWHCRPPAPALLELAGTVPLRPLGWPAALPEGSSPLALLSSPRGGYPVLPSLTRHCALPCFLFPPQYLLPPNSLLYFNYFFLHFSPSPYSTTAGVFHDIWDFDLSVHCS